MASENLNSLSKKEAIEQLRKTIGQLETIVQQLDKTSVIDLPSSASIQNLITTATELETIIAQKSALQIQEANKTEIIEAQLPTNITVTPEEQVTEKSINTTVSPKEKVTTEPEIKNFEPASAKSKIKEQEPKLQQNTEVEKAQKARKNRWIFLGVAAALLITIIPLSWKLFLSEKTPQLIAQDIPTTIIKPETETIIVPEALPEDTQSVTDDEIAATISNSEEKNSELETELNIEMPSELVAENSPKKVAIETIEPKIKLTPEQNLIAALENKADSIAARYNEDLVLSIKPDFTDSIVTVTLANDWYELLASNQDKIAEEMLKRSQQLKFNKLKIIDPKNNLIARSPVVGKDIVILRRTI